MQPQHGNLLAMADDSFDQGDNFGQGEHFDHRDICDFVRHTTEAAIPEPVIETARRCLLDLIGVAAAGRATRLSAIIGHHAAQHFGPGSGQRSPLMFDGRPVSPAGSALAAGMTIDAIDAHDGHRLTKGHTGAHQLPALLAFMWSGLDDRPINGASAGRRFLVDLVVGYEFATRAGIALHASAPDYHTSGAWGAVGCAAMGSRLLGLNRTKTLHALGIAEYHGPRSQMMRVIDHPTMLKDGSGWGAMAGVSAAYLAADGFTGAPAITITDPALAPIWSDLGTKWIIDDQYFKPYPICRWAQPAVEAALGLLETHPVDPEQIAEVHVHTFHEAARLTTALPTTTEEAQYSLPFPVAAALRRGRLTAIEVTDALDDAKIRDLSTRVTIIEDDGHNTAFPGRRYGRVTMVMNDGHRFASADHEPRGEPESPLDDAELLAKYHALADPVLGERRAGEIATLVGDLDRPGVLPRLLDQLANPIDVRSTS